MNKEKLPLRIGVGIIILNKKNEVFVGKRKDNPTDKWQMPQGGVNNEEDFITATKIHSYLLDAYEAFNYKPIIVPKTTIKERINFILNEIEEN